MSEHAKYSPRRFHPQAEAALADPVLRQNFRGAMDYLRAKRRDAFADPAEEAAVRNAAEQIRQRCLSRLPDLLVQLETNCERNGIRVHWAQTPAEANAIILRIAQQHGVSSIVKGKSMVSEEVGFNHEMARHGIRCLESDMGSLSSSSTATPVPHHHARHPQEQAGGERHLRRQPGGFHPHHRRGRADPDRAAGLARRVSPRRHGALRRQFRGGRNRQPLSGGERGQRRMHARCRKSMWPSPASRRWWSFYPTCHPLQRLTRSATGQAITTYFNVISGPRRAGSWTADEVHLVLLDNYAARLIGTRSCARPCSASAAAPV